MMKKKQGFTLVEILMVVAIIGMLAAVGIPSFMNSRQSASTKVKEMNIQAVNAAKDQWAVIENKAAGESVYWSDIEDYIGGGINSQSDLDVDGTSISLNNIGSSASY